MGGFQGGEPAVGGVVDEQGALMGMPPVFMYCIILARVATIEGRTLPASDDSALEYGEDEALDEGDGSTRPAWAADPA